MRLPVALRVALFPARLAVRLSPLRFVTGGREARDEPPPAPAFKCPACSYTLRHAAPASCKYICPRCAVELGPRGVAPPAAAAPAAERAM